MNPRLVDRRPPPDGAIPAARSPRPAYYLMLCSSFTFALMSACSHALAGRCDWRITALARSGIAFGLTALIARRREVRLIFRWPRTLWVRSAVGSISMLFTFYSLAHLPIGTALTLFNTFPIWVTLLAWPVLGIRPTATVGMALVSAVLGVVFIEQPHTAGFRVASVSALFASVCTAVVMLGLHRLRTINSLAIVVHFSAIATLTCLAYIALSTGSAPLDTARLTDSITLALLVGVGGFATLGQIAMTKAFSFGPPQKLAIVGLAQVVFAFVIDWAIWGRTPDALMLAGILLILTPVAWLIGRPPRP